MSVLTERSLRDSFHPPMGWLELLKRTLRETSADDGLGLAAQLAYYLFLALVPTLLVLTAVAGVVADGAFVDRVVAALARIAPSEVVTIVRAQLADLSESNNGGILTLGAASALWSSSAAMAGLMRALNRAYAVTEARPWWRQRGVAILLTLGVGVFILVSITLVVAGPQLAQMVAGRVGLGAAFTWTWTILQWPLVFVLIATAFGLIYYFAPNVSQGFVWLTPGSVFAALLWIGGSLGFRYYVVHVGSFNATYGVLGTVMVLMLWLYISSLFIIVGAEMNSEIAHARPAGHDGLTHRDLPMQSRTQLNEPEGKSPSAR